MQFVEAIYACRRVAGLEAHSVSYLHWASPYAHEMVTEEADADDQIPLKKATHQQGAAWGVPSMGKQPHRKRQLPAFSVWQAGQLFGRDVMFGSFLLLTFFLYLRSTVPELCSIGPPPLGSGSSWNSSAPAPQPDEWPFTFRLVCGHVQGSLSTWNTQKIRSRFSSVVSSLDGSSSSSEAAQSAASASAGSQLGISVLLRSLLDSVIVFCAVLGLQVLRVLVYVGQVSVVNNRNSSWLCCAYPARSMWPPIVFVICAL